MIVSPWFEARRTDYFARLLAVSTDGGWDRFVGFFAAGLRQAADSTREQMLKLVAVQNDLKKIIRAWISYRRANKLVGQLVDLGVLDVLDPDAYKRRFYAPRVLDVLTKGT